tara:strand:+ start:1423 stop:1695 length:273 start_codon:yes stop_codon:yes gene_type:complete
MSKKVKVEPAGKPLNELEQDSLDYVARFACLMYGVNVAADAAERMGMDTERDSKWIKPIFFQKYIDERFEDMKYNINNSLQGREDEAYSW